MLAEVVPNLTEISLSGLCWQGTLNRFGLYCPKLTTLNIEALQVPLHVIEHLASQIPNLATLNINNLDITAEDEVRLGVYMDAVLHSIQHCKNLTTLNFNFPDSITLRVQPESWPMLPKGVQHFRCSCRVPYMHAFSEALRVIPSLCLHEFPGWADTLADMFFLFPALQKTQSLSGIGIFLECGKSEYFRNSAEHKHRYLDPEFSLDCKNLNVSGSSTHVSEVFDWMPALPLIDLVDFFLEDRDERVHCLQQLPRIFPNLKVLHVGGDHDGDEGPWGLDASFVEPLAACQHLTSIYVREPFTLTASGLRELCRCLRKSVCLNFHRCEGADGDALVAEVEMLGSEFLVELSRHFGQYTVMRA